MQIGSAATALFLLRGGKTPAPAPATAPATARVTPPAPPPEAPGVRVVRGDYSTDPTAYEPPRPVTEEDRRITALVERHQVVMRKMVSGEIGPFDAEALEVTGHKKLFDMMNTDPRVEFMGAFCAGASDFRMGVRSEQAESNFNTRRDAMATAFHFARELALDIGNTVSSLAFVTDDQRTDDGRIIGVSRNGEFLNSAELARAADDAGTFLTVHTMRSMELNAAELARRFGFDTTSVTLPAYAGERKGFTIGNTEFGKLLEVGADGTFTFYGSDGAAHSAKDYYRQRIDGGVPELSGYLVDEAFREETFALAREQRARLEAQG